MWDSDEALIQGMEQQSNHAFQIFYERYIDYVYRIVYGVVKDHHHALDLCQDLFLEFFQKASTFDAGRGSVKAWVAVRARSRSVDFIRKQQREFATEDLSDKQQQTMPSPQDYYIQKEESKRLVEHLFKLPAHERNAIVDNYVHSKTHREIAEKLNRPLGSVKSSIRYGIQKLRSHYLVEGQNGNRGDSNEQSLNR